MKNKSLMFFTVLAFMLLFVPTVKAEAAIRQTEAYKYSNGTEAITVEWDAVGNALWYEIYINGRCISDEYYGTDVTLYGFQRGTPYAFQLSYVYYNAGYYWRGWIASGTNTVLRTRPNKIASDEYYVSWNSKDKINVEYVDTSLYTKDGRTIEKYINGIEFKVKDVKGKGKKTVKKTPKNRIIYTKASDLIDSFKFSAPSAIKNKGMQYQFRTYITINKAGGGTQKIYSEWTSAQAYVPQAKITNLQVVGKNKVKVTWKKVSGAKNYTIYKTTNGGKSFKKVKTVKANSTTAPAANNTVRKPQTNGSSYKKVSTVSSTTSSYTVSGFKKGSKYGVVVVANKVKVGKKKYNSTRSYYTHR